MARPYYGSCLAHSRPVQLDELGHCPGCTRIAERLARTLPATYQAHPDYLPAVPARYAELRQRIRRAIDPRPSDAYQR